jgi:hypothetical protein
MANLIQAINTYRPRLELGRTVQTDELVNYVAGRTGLNASELVMALMEVRDAIIYYNRMGRGVKVAGLGTYLPNIHLDGTLDVEHRLDKSIKRGLNEKKYVGHILNQKYIGKTSDDLVAVWNVEHPDDPVIA